MDIKEALDERISGLTDKLGSILSICKSLDPDNGHNRLGLEVFLSSYTSLVRVDELLSLYLSVYPDDEIRKVHKMACDTMSYCRNKIANISIGTNPADL